MKELLVIRHGKSSWDDPQLADRDRPLKERGRQAVPDMGRRLAARASVPERIVSSDAKRALETARLFAAAAGVGEDAVVVEPQLYTGDAADVLTVVRRIDEPIERAAVVGHNPALHDFLHTVSDLRLSKYPTAGVAHLRFPVGQWREIGAERAEVVDYDYPKSGRQPA